MGGSGIGDPENKHRFLIVAMWLEASCWKMFSRSTAPGRVGTTVKPGGPRLEAVMHHIGISENESKSPGIPKTYQHYGFEYSN
jgi:hypothetical protein